MSDDKKFNAFFAKYLGLAKKCKEENRMIFNHVCLRVENIGEAEKLLCDSFGLESFLRPGGETFDKEKEFSVTWMQDNNMYLEISAFEEPQQIGYDTGIGQPIGHLSEMGFFVPSMDKALADLEPKGWEVTSTIEIDGAKMFKINNSKTPGMPVELIDYESDSWEP